MNSNQSYTIALAGNPNVGKSTVFNAITGMNQHTGNWSGKTVEVCTGEFKAQGNIHKIIDLPGSYSIFAESEEEAVTDDFLQSDKFDAVIIVVDSNALERNLSFALQILMNNSNAVLCLNMADVAEKNGISIDTDELSLRLGIPVVKVSAKKKKGIEALKEKAIDVASKRIKTHRVSSIDNLNSISEHLELIKEIADKCREIVKYSVSSNNIEKRNITDKLDVIFTSPFTGTVTMLVFLFALFWLTAFGANYPSQFLSELFSFLTASISRLLTDLNVPQAVCSFICDGVLKTAGWVVAVMLPPAIIFFPIFAILEDWGYLPRIAFNLDGLFSKAGVSGKQALTMMMGFGCNACGVVGCRIINSKQERNIAMLTNSFIPCNGRIPTLIALSSIFISATFTEGFTSLITAIQLLVLILLAVLITLVTSKILSNFYKSKSSVFTLELPYYKKPQIVKTIGLSLKNKVLSILCRAVCVALPAGAIIWLVANIKIGDTSILKYLTDFLDPFAQVMGIDGTILAAFILGFPANEIVIPVILMSYTAGGSLTEYNSLNLLGELLRNNGWDNVTAICTMILCMFHFPCSTTCITIYKETKSKALTVLSVIIPLTIGVMLCVLINQFYRIFF